MVKPINQKKDPSGTYRYKDYQVEELPYFLYEVSISQYWSNGYALLNHKFIKSNEELKIKNDSIIKRYNNCILEKHISLLGAPHDFVKSLPEYKLYKKRK